MSTFRITDQEKGLDVEVELCEGLKKEELEGFSAFKTWLPRLSSSLALQHTNPNHPHNSDPYYLSKITTQSYTRFGTSKIGFMTLTAVLENKSKTSSLPGSIFLRGPAVGMLLVLRPDDEKGENERWVVLTSQARVAAGSLEFLELPAGMVDEERNFAGAAAREIEEETGLVISAEELIDLTALAGVEVEEGTPKGMFPSAGGCDEFITLYLGERRVSRGELEELKGKLTGLREEGEKITLKLVKFEDLWREGARDAKALGALALYEGLKRNGKL